ncbi:hypothetical protein J6590_071849 [Homalodisca vitripennis]|nr:hypothetical protein J6590_071849 [Homalodisca vitripennis]
MPNSLITSYQKKRSQRPYERLRTISVRIMPKMFPFWAIRYVGTTPSMCSAANSEIERQEPVSCECGTLSHAPHLLSSPFI